MLIQKCINGVFFATIRTRLYFWLQVEGGLRFVQSAPEKKRLEVLDGLQCIPDKKRLNLVSSGVCSIALMVRSCTEPILGYVNSAPKHIQLSRNVVIPLLPDYYLVYFESFDQISNPKRLEYIPKTLLSTLTITIAR